MTSREAIAILDGLRKVGKLIDEVRNTVTLRHDLVDGTSLAEDLKEVASWLEEYVLPPEALEPPTKKRRKKPAPG
jgi:hypothetical protein